MWLIVILGLFCFSACSNSGQADLVDKLNSLSYSFHYRNLDSVSTYAARALSASGRYSSGKAEAYNNLAFVDIARMEYRSARLRLDSVCLSSDNQVELLVADVQYMRLCQRESRNKDFYSYRERAIRRMKRIEEELGSMTPRMKMRYLYAKTEFPIVCSTYYYYVGLDKAAVESMALIDPSGEIQRDTAQYLNYLYQIGSGGIIMGMPREATLQKEFEHLLKCHLLASRCGMTYWQANSLQAISEHLLNGEDGKRLASNNKAAMTYLNNHDMPDSLMAGYLAQMALDLFVEYGDVYQVAAAYRTLSRCYWALGDNSSSLICLERALTGNSAIRQAPAMIASIRECLSLVYSAMNDKNNSDINRNAYLDIQEETRQDRQLEARAEQLEHVSAQLNMLIVCILALIMVIVTLLFVFHKLGKNKNNDAYISKLLLPLEEWEKRNNQKIAEQKDRYEAVNERMALIGLQLDKDKRRSLDNKAKVFIVSNVVTYIDRIINEVKKLKEEKYDESVRNERFSYMTELTEKINEYNNVLTHWIQLQQGQLNLHIESFNLKDVFDVLARSGVAFKLNGIRLNVATTDMVVKADKVLTLFMLNTLADNARKFTPEGGHVDVYAEGGNGYVEISVKDSGIGLSESELAGIFDRKINNGHGFGLMNCKGIMDKYKKISHIFNVCGIFAESVKGKGSRFYFRLPYGIFKCIMLVVGLLSFVNVNAWNTNDNSDVAEYLLKADACADSAYFCNVNGEYKKALVFADSVVGYLNAHYKYIHPHGSDLMVLSGGRTASLPAELKWFHDSVRTNYDVILDIRNESAVAALALHEWDMYVYNNDIYTRLFKERSADSGLDDYCLTMQESRTNKTIAVIVLVLLLFIIVSAFYFLYYRHVLYFRFCAERVNKANKVLLSDASGKEKFDAINSIDTSKYPETLKIVINKVKDELERSVTFDESSQLSLELAEDELSRMKYETEKMYVCNNVIDNGLSALKHETMYYPARISQLVNEADKNIDSLSEVVVYYKDLYNILCNQVREQAEAIMFECVPVSLKDWTCIDRYVLFDKTLLSYLFDVLNKQCEISVHETVVTHEDVKYLTLELKCKKTVFLDENRHDLFAPLVQNIPFFVCRQIMREVAEQTNRHGCGLRISSDNNGITYIFVIFAKAFVQ